VSKVKLSRIDAILDNENFLGSIASIYRNDIQIVVLIVIVENMNIEINSSNFLMNLSVLQIN
jgi:hypothetical protein